MKQNGYNLLFELTQKCNLNCEYCFYRDYGRSPSELNFGQFQEIIDKYENMNNIYFTGGECTLATDFVRILQLAKMRANVSIFTNGLTIINDVFYNDIDKYIDNYIVTLDSFRSDYKCRLNTESTMETIKKIAKNSPNKLIVKICINKYNLLNLELTIQELIALGVKKISINFVHNIQSNNINFELSKNELEKVFCTLDKYKSHLFINFYDKIKDFYLNGDHSVERYCCAGKSFYYYDCQANKRDCPAEYCEDRNCLTKECISIFEMFEEDDNEYSI